jgi:hypothetical protein
LDRRETVTKYEEYETLKNSFTDEAPTNHLSHYIYLLPKYFYLDSKD